MFIRNGISFGHILQSEFFRIVLVNIVSHGLCAFLIPVCTESICLMYEKTAVMKKDRGNCIENLIGIQKRKRIFIFPQYNPVEFSERLFETQVSSTLFVQFKKNITGILLKLSNEIIRKNNTDGIIFCRVHCTAVNHTVVDDQNISGMQNLAAAVDMIIRASFKHAGYFQIPVPVRGNDINDILGMNINPCQCFGRDFYDFVVAFFLLLFRHESIPPS